jgi:hypothetical protein
LESAALLLLQLEFYVISCSMNGESKGKKRIKEWGMRKRWELISINVVSRREYQAWIKAWKALKKDEWKNSAKFMFL